MKLKFTAALIVLFIVACTASQHMQPVDADLAPAQQRIPGITMTDLQAGYKIYVTNCSGCHRLHNPNEYNATKWKTLLLEMFGKAKLNDDRQKQLVTNFLVAKSK